MASPAHAQLFLASRPHPAFEIGPLFVRASLTPDLENVTVDVLWNLEIPSTRSALELEQDLYLLWPGRVEGVPSPSRPDPSLGRYVEARGFTVLATGRLPLHALNLYAVDRDQESESLGTAPFVTFVQAGGAFGLTAPASYVRVPWTAKLANRAWLIDLRMKLPGLVKHRKTTWIEHLFQGARHTIAIGYNDVRARALFPIYFEQRDRAIALGQAPAELVINFADSEHLKIDQVFPQSSTRSLSESLESTEVVAFALEKSQGITPQLLTVQFGYLSGLQPFAPVVISLAFFVLGNLLGPLPWRLVASLTRVVKARIQLGVPGEDPRGRRTGVTLSSDTLSRIVPGETTYDEVIRLCGPDAEHLEQRAAPGHRTLIYRGRRIVPRRKHTYGWVATVSHWDLEEHTAQIDLEGDRVRDVQARVRRFRLAQPETPTA